MQEITLLSGENQQARLALQAEQQREKNARQAGLAGEARGEAEQHEAAVRGVQCALDNTLMHVERNQTTLEITNNKLNALLEKLQVTWTNTTISLLS